jgi:acylaminoacyl-peptidase
MATERASRTSSDPSSSPARLWADICLASPALVSARALEPDGRLITASWTQRDVVTSSLRQFSVDYARGDALPSAAAVVGATPAHAAAAVAEYAAFAPVEQNAAAATQFCSPSGRRLVRFVERSGGGSGANGDSHDGSTRDDVVVEIWGHEESDAGMGLQAVWKVPAANVHGHVFTDEWFGGVAWSPDENLFIYVAERPPLTSRDAHQRDDLVGRSAAMGNAKTSAFADKEAKTEMNSWMDGLRSKFEQSARDPLGEAYVNRKSPALFVADIRKLASRPMCTPDPDNPDFEGKDMFGDPQWSPDGRWIAVTRRPTVMTEPSVEADGISDSPYDLGVRYCYNRYSSIEIFGAPTGLDDAASALEGIVPVSDHSNLDDFCCSSPRFSPDSECLVYISAPRKALGRAGSTVQPHNTAKVLRAALIFSGDTLSEPAASTPVTLVDVIRLAGRDKFPGLHLHALPQRPWLGGSKTMLFSSAWGSNMRPLSVSILVDGTGTKREIVCPLPPTDVMTNPKRPGREEAGQSVMVLDVCSEGAIVSVSTPVQMPRLGILRISNGVCELRYVSKMSKAAEVLAQVACPIVCSDLMLNAATDFDSIDANLVAREFQSGDDELNRYQATLIVPKCAMAKKTPVPLIVSGHGGPHSSCINSHTQSGAAILASGMAVLYINYRGSLGFGQDALETLPGRAGFQDVAEVLQATQWALQKAAPSLLNKERVGYVGGSHGGFLGAHLSVIPGTPIKRTALRNPVINVASMVNVTDIPEWAFCEAGVAPICAATGLALTADPPALEKMWRVSPVARVRKGGQHPGPTLLFVGGSDKRVPPAQSVEWMRLITEAYGPGIVTMRWYKGSGHAIDEVPNGDDVWVHTLEFFKQL